MKFLSRQTKGWGENKYIKRLITSIVMIIIFGLGISGQAMAATAVNLGTATPFAILAGTPGITDAGNVSVIAGDVGLSPGPGAGIGILCSQVTGTIYAVDATGSPCFTVNGPLLVTAKDDLTTAYNQAASQTPATIVPTELGGTTLTPGVYGSNSTTFQISAGAGHLVLNGQGDSSAVFIFEMNAEGTGLTVGPGSTVSLVNGARACNVFWRVDTATINTTAVFKGTILALSSITVANGSNIEGRLLARNGDVTLINDTVTAPTCTTPTSPGGGSGSPTTTSTSLSNSSKTAPGAPNTGFGVNSVNPLLSLAPYSITAISFLVIAYATRRYSAKNLK